MRPPQFSIRTLLVAMLVVAAFLGGMLFEKARLEAGRIARQSNPAMEVPW